MEPVKPSWLPKQMPNAGVYLPSEGTNTSTLGAAIPCSAKLTSLVQDRQRQTPQGETTQAAERATQASEGPYSRHYQNNSY